MEYVGEILPVDHFSVLLNENLPSRYEHSLTHLYKPLIGIETVSLYETLLSEAILMEQLHIKTQTHHTLMSSLHLPLDEIYKARLKLEALGLLTTCKEESEVGTLYTYEILPPFSPEDFFSDVMLTELLLHHIGEARFNLLKEYYKKEKKVPKGTNITASFHDVFQTFSPKSSISKARSIPKKQHKVPIQQIDLSILHHTLKQQNIDAKNVLTERNVRIINQLTHLYDLELYEVEKALMWALTTENKLDIKQFKAACHDFFKSKHNVANIRLMPKEEATKEQKETSLSPRERLIHRLETISPKQLLEDLSEGQNATEQDMKIIRDLMIKQGLPAPVMNVLIHFTLLRSNMKLSKGYMEKIAGHWSRARLKTAREAMEFALEQSKPQQQTNRRANQRRTKTKEVIPDWFKNREKKATKNNEITTEKDRKKQEEMAAILQKYNS